jgi:peptidoglycan-associated lipoprotein
MKKFLKVSALAVVLGLGLSACMNVSPKHSGDVPVTDGSGLTSYGLGENGEIIQDPNFGFVNGKPTGQTYFFPFDSHVISKEYDANLNAQAKYLVDHRDVKILLAGHTDERGSREYNIALGERRSQSVKQVLQADGVDASQIKTVSYGEEKPLVSGHTEEDYRQNRRVELSYENLP